MTDSTAYLRTRIALAGIMLALLAAVAGLLSSAGTARATPAAAPAAKVAPAVAADSIQLRLYQGMLNRGATARYCFQFHNYANVGPVAVLAEPTSYGVVLKTVSTDMERRLGFGYAYCATIRNESASLNTGVYLLARGGL